MWLISRRKQISHLVASTLNFIEWGSMIGPITYSNVVLLSEIVVTAVLWYYLLLWSRVTRRDRLRHPLFPLSTLDSLLPFISFLSFFLNSLLFVKLEYRLFASFEFILLLTCDTSCFRPYSSDTSQQLLVRLMSKRGWCYGNTHQNRYSSFLE